jgi:hypothetical protein
MSRLPGTARLIPIGIRNLPQGAAPDDMSQPSGYRDTAATLPLDSLGWSSYNGARLAPGTPRFERLPR